MGKKGLQRAFALASSILHSFMGSIRTANCHAIFKLPFQWVSLCLRDPGPSLYTVDIYTYYRYMYYLVFLLGIYSILLPSLWRLPQAWKWFLKGAPVASWKICLSVILSVCPCVQEQQIKQLYQFRAWEWKLVGPERTDWICLGSIWIYIAMIFWEGGVSSELKTKNENFSSTFHVLRGFFFFLLFGLFIDCFNTLFLS